MKLVLEHHWSVPYEASGTITMPFEYESKEKFVFDVLEKFKDKEWITYSIGPHHMDEEVELFGITMTKWDIEAIEHHVYTLEEWFERKKEKIEI